MCICMHAYMHAYACMHACTHACTSQGASLGLSIGPRAAVDGTPPPRKSTSVSGVKTLEANGQMQALCEDRSCEAGT